MATELTIHIGPPKTGSTTLQAALAAHRSELLTHGVLYPVSAAGDLDQHLAAAIDLAACTGTEVRMSRFSRALFTQRAWYSGSWQKLLEDTENHAGPVIWSSEGFTYLDDQGISALAQLVHRWRTRVVIVGRHTGRHLVSQYMEQAKRDTVPLLSDYTSSVVSGLLEGTPQEFNYLDQPRTVERWTRVGEVITVGQPGTPLADALAHAWTILTPDLGLDAHFGHRNRQLTGWHLAGWQHHLRVQRPTYYGALAQTLDRWSANHPISDDPHYGPRLRPEIEQTLQDAFGMGSTAAQRDSARSSLQRMIATGDTLTMPETPWPSTTHSRQQLSALRRTQRLANARWRAYDAAATALRRRRPMRIDWSLDDGLHPVEAFA